MINAFRWLRAIARYAAERVVVVVVSPLFMVDHAKLIVEEASEKDDGKVEQMIVCLVAVLSAILATAATALLVRGVVPVVLRTHSILWLTAAACLAWVAGLWSLPLLRLIGDFLTLVIRHEKESLLAHYEELNIVDDCRKASLLPRPASGKEPEAK